MEGGGDGDWRSDVCRGDQDKKGKGLGLNGAGMVSYEEGDWNRVSCIGRLGPRGGVTGD